uniref:Secreted protein n=1 Tax=Triticum urartu TaxID=4572 RepID=A0A8R7Q2W3_TRIUA
MLILNPTWPRLALNTFLEVCVSTFLLINCDSCSPPYSRKQLCTRAVCFVGHNLNITYWQYQIATCLPVLSSSRADHSLPTFGTCQRCII